ncbi:pyridoxal phosphate-dependent transferase [Xylariales sp. PMI_506]|nr:pyridoxal phosphate-dependent transferase [Xylariales sp. PMI_506]
MGPMLSSRMQPIYARKLYDIRWRDILYALQAFAWSFFPDQHNGNEEKTPTASLERLWAPGQTFVSMSVRSAFDLVLQASAFPAGSEILMSAVTIPDMARIVQANGLVPIPIDLQDDATVSAADVERRLTPKTRIVLIAQLFGSRQSLYEIAELLAARPNILLIEDCAQAFTGRDFTGNPEADASLFSFGPIKTCTAFGGAVCTVRKPELLAKMCELQATYPQQANNTFLKKVIKYAAFKLITDNPRLYGIFISSVRISGRDHHAFITSLSHSLTANQSLISQIRLRPSETLLQLLDYRISRFDPGAIETRRKRIKNIIDALPPSMLPIGCTGSRGPNYHYWICPISVKSPPQVLDALLEAGFDAAAGDASLTVVQGYQGETTTQRASSLMESIVYLPLDNHLSTIACVRLIETLSRSLK